MQKIGLRVKMLVNRAPPGIESRAALPGRPDHTSCRLVGERTRVRKVLSCPCRCSRRTAARGSWKPKTYKRFWARALCLLRPRSSSADQPCKAATASTSSSNARTDGRCPCRSMTKGDTSRFVTRSSELSRASSCGSLRHRRAILRCRGAADATETEEALRPGVAAH